MAFKTGRKFYTKILLLTFLWILAIFTFTSLRHYKIDVSVPHLNSRFLLYQHSAETPTTTTSSNSGATDNAIYPSIDKRPTPSETEIIRNIQQKMPNLPIIYWNNMKNIKMSLNKTCAKFPSLFELEFNNLYWQTLRTKNGTFQLYGAYLDKRKLNKLSPTIRILGMLDRIEPRITTYCQIWYDDVKEPVITKVLEYKYIWYKKWGNYKQGIYQPYLLSCGIPQGLRGKEPKSVSLVENKCDTSSVNLRVINNDNGGDNKKKFAVCVKGLDFLHEDLSVRLVEWIELLRILGVDKINFYTLQVHANMTKVLKHYESLNYISVTPHILAGGQPNAPLFQHLYLTKKTNSKRQNELIPYNDCFYKNMYNFEYIALLDIDEIIMPKIALTYSELFDQLRKNSSFDEKASVNFRNVYFLDDLSHKHGWFNDIPQYMHMLQHVFRTKNYTKPGQYVKCFHKTEKVLTLHNHFPLSCLGGKGCSSFGVSTTDAQLQHYRADCVATLKKSCQEMRRTSVMDTTIWKFKKELIERTRKTLDVLGFFETDDKKRKN